MTMMSKNIFLDIVEKKIAAEIVYEDDLCLAFPDKFPQAPTHILIIPKKEIRTHADISPEDQLVLGKMHLAAVEIGKKLGIHDYRLTINCGEGSGQTVPHLHMHFMAGRAFRWPPG